MASPKALMRATPAARRLAFWRAVARDAGIALRATPRGAAARMLVRRAAARALTGVETSRAAIGKGPPSFAAPFAIIRAGGADAARAALAGVTGAGVEVVPAAAWAKAAGAGRVSGRCAMFGLDGAGLAPDGPEMRACREAGAPVTVFLDDADLPHADSWRARGDVTIGWRAAATARLGAVALLTRARAARAHLGADAWALMCPADQDSTLRAALRQAGFLAAASPITGPARIDQTPYERLTSTLDRWTPPAMAARRLGLTRR